MSEWFKTGPRNILHDQWAKMGYDNLGGDGSPNLAFTRLASSKEEGLFTLMKCVLNDHWADVPGETQDWPAEHVDYVMSKLYYIWCAMLDEKHPLSEDEAWRAAKEEDE